MLIDALRPYALSVASLGAIGALLFVQILVADLAGIAAKHKPGSGLDYDPASFHFRASRAFANTNESIAAFVVLLLFGLLMGASPVWLNGLAGQYLVGRIGHMLCYWLNWPLARSVSFGISLLALPGLAIAGVLAC